MKVRHVMTRQAVACRPHTTLAEAAILMKNGNCGFLPVIGDGENVIGVLTDRDICIALGTRQRTPGELSVWDVMPGKLFTCTPDDSINCALKTMRMARVRRLPVIDRDGGLVGVLSIDDIVLHAQEYARSKDAAYKDIEDTYKTICGCAAPSRPRHAAA